jgi:hypothetical protein
VRRRTLRFFVIMMLAIWCGGRSSASQGHPLNTHCWRIGATAEA